MNYLIFAIRILKVVAKVKNKEKFKIMKLFYTIIDALAFLKYEIERLEQKMKNEKSQNAKRYIESVIEWNLERGVKLIEFTRKDEINAETLDFFFGRTKIRPDMSRMEKLYGDVLRKKM